MRRSSSDQDVVVAVSAATLTAIAPCRIVWVVDEPDAFGFGYGTLQGHPEEGEESFVVRGGPGGARFEVTALSRPASLEQPRSVRRWLGGSNCGSRVATSPGIRDAAAAV